MVFAICSPWKCSIWDALPFEMLHWDFMKNAFLAMLLMAPLFGLLSTMIVTGRMSFFSDALGHSAFTGIAIGAICGLAAPTWAAVGFSVCFALVFSSPSPRRISECWLWFCWQWLFSGWFTPTD